MRGAGRGEGCRLLLPGGGGPGVGAGLGEAPRAEPDGANERVVGPNLGEWRWKLIEPGREAGLKCGGERGVKSSVWVRGKSGLAAVGRP